MCILFYRKSSKNVQSSIRSYQPSESLQNRFCLAVTLGKTYYVKKMKTRTMTQMITLKTFFIFLLAALPSFMLAQGGSGKKVKSREWQDLVNQNDYKIQYRYNICDMKEDGIVKEEVYLQVSNLTDDTLRVSWDLELFYGERCYNCQGENDELKISFTLQPNEIIEGFCGDDNKYYLRLFSKFINGEAESKLSDFNLRNLKINTVQSNSDITPK